MDKHNFNLESVCFGLLVNGLDGFHKDDSDVMGYYIRVVNRLYSGLVILPPVVEIEYVGEHDFKETYVVGITLKRVDNSGIQHRTEN